MEQILIVEDDKGLSTGLCRALKTEKRQVIACGTLQAARDQLLCQMPDLILMDLNLPDGNGLTLLGQLRLHSLKPPVILLTANDTDEDVVRGLEQGADDYITKPFSLAVLRARVNAQLRKSESFQKDPAVRMGKYCFDFGTQRFLVGETPVELSKTEQKLLRILTENRGRTMERSALADRIWNDGAEYVDENALSVTVKRLRDKLDAKDSIKTVYGIGYMWVDDHA